MAKTQHESPAPAYSIEDAVKIAAAINVTRKYDEMLMKLSQFKEKLAKEILTKPMRSGVLKKMLQENHAGKTISKGWKKRETELASEGLHKLSEALEKVALSKEMLEHAGSVASGKKKVAINTLVKALKKRGAVVGMFNKLNGNTYTRLRGKLREPEKVLDKEIKVRRAQEKLFKNEAPNRKSNPNFKSREKTPLEELALLHAEKTSSVSILKTAMAARPISHGQQALKAAITKQGNYAEDILTNVLLAGAGAGIGAVTGGEEGKDPENLGKTINRETGALRGTSMLGGLGIGKTLGNYIGMLSDNPRTEGALGALLGVGGGIGGYALAKKYGPQYEWEQKKERIEG